MIVEIQAHGYCLGPEWESCVAVVDTDAPVHSGDIVRVVVPHQTRNGDVTFFKQLEVTRDGRWWLQCLEAVMLIGRELVPTIIEKVVDRRTVPRTSIGMTVDPDMLAGRDTLAMWDRLSLDARAEWTAYGKQRGVRFPGINDAIRAAL